LLDGNDWLKEPYLFLNKNKSFKYSIMDEAYDYTSMSHYNRERIKEKLFRE
jgi:hypothetical protein